MGWCSKNRLSVSILLNKFPTSFRVLGSLSRDTNCSSSLRISRFWFIIPNSLNIVSDKFYTQVKSVAQFQLYCHDYIRTKISFELIRSQIMNIRGSRRRRKIEIEAEEIEVVESLNRMQTEWSLNIHDGDECAEQNEQKRIMDWLVTVLGLYWRRMKEKKDADLYIKFHVKKNYIVRWEKGHLRAYSLDFVYKCIPNFRHIFVTACRQVMVFVTCLI